MLNVNIEAMRNYRWVKQMPQLQREFFLEIMSKKTIETRSAREYAENKYYDLMSENISFS